MAGYLPSSFFVCVCVLLRTKIELRSINRQGTRRVISDKELDFCFAVI